MPLDAARLRETALVYGSFHDEMSVVWSASVCVTVTATRTLLSSLHLESFPSPKIRKMHTQCRAVTTHGTVADLRKRRLRRSVRSFKIPVIIDLKSMIIRAIPIELGCTAMLDC